MSIIENWAKHLNFFFENLGYLDRGAFLINIFTVFFFFNSLHI